MKVHAETIGIIDPKMTLVIREDESIMIARDCYRSNKEVL